MPSRLACFQVRQKCVNNIFLSFCVIQIMTITTLNSIQIINLTLYNEVVEYCQVLKFDSTDVDYVHFLIIFLKIWDISENDYL